MKLGRLIPDGKVLTKEGQVNVTKVRKEGGREGGSVCWSTRLVIRWQYFNSPSLPPCSS